MITADQKAPRAAPRSFLIRVQPGSSHRAVRRPLPEMVELTGIEPATYGLQSRRSPS
jgi:hypothetical protein